MTRGRWGSRRRDFDAFISYSHRSDLKRAKVVERQLERFLPKRELPRGSVRVFRDLSDLPRKVRRGEASDEEVERVLSEFLARSGMLIVFASPFAARSPWVSFEIAEWLRLYDSDRHALCLTGGELHWDPVSHCFDPNETTALPSPLLAEYRQEPLWVDLRDLAQQETEHAITMLLSMMLNLSMDDIVSTSRRHRLGWKRGRRTSR